MGFPQNELAALRVNGRGLALGVGVDTGGIVAVSYTHLDVYKRQASSFVVMASTMPLSARAAARAVALSLLWTACRMSAGVPRKPSGVGCAACSCRAGPAGAVGSGTKRRSIFSFSIPARSTASIQSRS